MSKQLEQMKRKEGFTLVEIMFVVAIIGLLASIGIPAVLNAFDQGKEKARQAHIASIEKAKSMLTLPQLVYDYGRSLPSGAEFGEGEYTEENLVACMQNISDLDELAVDGQHIVPGKIGEKAYYSNTKPASD